MKKVFVLTFIIVLIPYLILNMSKENKSLKFNFISNKIVRVKREEKGIIENVSFEDYVKGVLAGEMPVSFDKEALKAQAVAARSYVLKEMEKNIDNVYDVLDTVSNQVYLSDNDLKERWGSDFEYKNELLKNVIEETRGEYISYNGEVVEALFFSTSSGKTENSGEVFSTQLPYLVSVDSTWDKEVSPVYNDTKKFSISEFCSLLDIDNTSELDISVISTTSTGSIRNIRINDKNYRGIDFRNKLGLRSTYFDIKKTDNEVIINTKGYGHGVGMSQYGALAMAQNGYNYEEILKYYYSGVEITKI